MARRRVSCPSMWGAVRRAVRRSVCRATWGEMFPCRSRLATTGVGARRAAGHGPVVAPASQRGVDRWFEKTSPTPAGAVAAGEPTVADEHLAVSKSVSSGRVPSRINDLSLKGRRAVDGAGVLSWLALLLFAGAVVVFGASASLTGSPLGLLERWIPMP